MTNGEISDHFSLLSKLMDIHGEDAFRAKNYSIAAYNIDKLPRQASEMDDAELFTMRGIGQSTGSKIRELLETGKLQALEDILARTPQGILDMMQIKGLGPKKIAQIWKEMGIESVGELEYACNENRLASFKGFGAKTQQSILQNIEFIRANQNFRLWAEVEEISNVLVTQLGKANPGKLFSLTGEIRRQLPTVEFIDIVTDTDSKTLQSQFGVTTGVKTEEKDNVLYVDAPNQLAIRVHLTTKEKFYNTLFSTSAGEEFLTAFTGKYTLPGTPASEEEIFSANKLEYIPPALRETADILDKAAANKLPVLIQPSDIKGIIHSHSTWSDGADTIEAMAKACIEQGYEYLVISDHSQAAFYANGLDPKRIAEQHREVDALNEKLAPFRIFKSIEVDILNDGSLDYSDDVLATLDLVIASVHTNLKMTQEKAMERVLKAIRYPYTTILGHPTGRLLLSREGYPLDHKVIIDECVKHNVVIEINAHPRRLDLDWKWISYAIEAGALLSIDPDAHAIAGYHDVYYGTLSAQKGGLTKERNLSSYSLKEFEAWLSKGK
ncbi:MAG: DNA polymerase/3'-5' exonuclease PolX [Chitinophagales bacterium]|nr:DNA polymerase/3'-5' exonuclease PolX [Chitinophagales bacterium]